MKKFWIFILSIVCLLSFCVATACNETEEEQQTSDIVLMRGFNTWDEIAVFDLYPSFFTGKWEINNDTAYINEGDGSWRIYVEKTGANQPNFKMVANSIKQDITDVCGFIAKRTMSMK